jgi:hypothetical protein
MAGCHDTHRTRVVRLVAQRLSRPSNGAAACRLIADLARRRNNGCSGPQKRSGSIHEVQFLCFQDLSTSCSPTYETASDESHRRNQA